MDLVAFIPSQLAILVAVLYVLGYAMKNVSGLQNEYIPLALIAFSILFSVLLLGATPTAILQGIICWGVSIGINQTYKQMNPKEKTKDIKEKSGE